jgi:putative ABC transport system permease protein
MAQGVRLRLGEFAVLKAIGFSHRLILALVMTEAALPCMAGAVAGLVAAPLLFAILKAALPPLAVFPALVYKSTMLAVAAALAVFIGGASGLLPALRIVRLDVAAALAGGLRTGTPKTDGKRTAPLGAGSSAILERPSLVPRGKERQRHLPRQIIAVARIGLSTLPQRWKNGLTIMVGVGCTVFVMHSLLAIAEGIRTGVLESGSPDRVIIHQMARWEPHLNMWDSHLPANAVPIAAAGPGVARGRNGATLVVPLLYSGVHMIKRNNGNDGDTTLIGAGPGWAEATPGFHLLWGRTPRPGARELIAGRNALGKFSTLDSRAVTYKKLRWTIVGGFTTGDWWNGYLVGDLATVRAAAKAPRDSAVLVKLKTPDTFAAFRRATQPKLSRDVIVERETDHYAGVWQSVPNSVYYVAYLLAALIAAGVIAATTHTMQVTVDGKAAETACLRALGFDACAIAIALVLEALLLAALGAAAGTFGV